MEEDKSLQKLTSEISGREREIVDQFCKAFIAQKVLEGFDYGMLFDKFRLVIQHDFSKEITTKYWFELKE